MSNSLEDLLAEHWHEVTLDQIKPGDYTVIIYRIGETITGVKATKATPSLIAAWNTGITPGRFYVPEPPAPEYAPGTLARITVGNGHGPHLAVRASDGMEWMDLDGSVWIEENVSHVEVISDPDGSRPVPQVTKEEGREIRQGYMLASNHTVDEDMAEAVQQFLNKKLGGQA